jgi:hypothetical protein
MFTVAGFYCQIRSQESLILPFVSRENFQLAFDLVQPVVSGNADLNSDEIPPDLLRRALHYTTATMLEVHDIRTNNRVAKLMSTRIMDHSITDRSAAIDGMFIRFQRGCLGLERLGAVGAMLVGAQKRVIRGIIAVSG